MKHRAVVVFALVAADLPGGARSDAPAAVHVAACGLGFDLPAGYGITHPKRSVDGRDGSRCAFDIVKAPAEPPQHGECKDEEDGGQPPYDVCDWVIDAGPATPSVRGVRARPEDRPRIEPFFRGEDGRWMLPDAQAGMARRDRRADVLAVAAREGLHGPLRRIGRYRRHAGAVRARPVRAVAGSARRRGRRMHRLLASLRLGARTQDLP